MQTYLLMSLSLSAWAIQIEEETGATFGALNEISDMPMPMPMMMPMYFWTGNEVTYLFKNITSDSTSGYTFGLICTFLLGLAIEFINYLRKYVHMKAQLASINAAVRHC